MFWFGVGCVFSGLAVGAILTGALGVALTSLQILLFVLALALARELSSMTALLWAVSGLFCHQAAFLAGVLLRVTLEESLGAAPSRSIAAEVDEELASIDVLANKLASEDPVLQPEAADLSFLVAQLRRTLNSQQRLQALLAARRRASG